VGLAPATAAGSTTYTLPSADGSANQVLQTNGSGVLSWSTGGSLTLIGTVTTNSGTQSGSISLPANWDTTYKYLQLILQGDYVSPAGSGALIFRFNSDASSVYGWSWFNQAISSAFNSQPYIALGNPFNGDPMRATFQISYNPNMAAINRIQMQGAFSKGNLFYPANGVYTASSLPTTLDLNPLVFGSGYYLNGTYTLYGVS
jgi:hypothetical protein